MSSFAQPLSAGGMHRPRTHSKSVLRRIGSTPRAPLPLSAIPIAAARGAGSFVGGGHNVSAWAFVVLAVAAHALLAWLAINHQPSQPNGPIKRELSFELERPKSPPKIEPPKPPPPKLERAAQVLPNIQEGVPDSNPQLAAVTEEEPVAVAPIVSAPPAPVPVTPAFGRAGYLNNPPPAYPAVASRLGLQGTVLLRVRVLSNGTAASVDVLTSSGTKALDDAAAATVKKWLFSPSKRGDVPIDGWATVPIEFKLDQ
jgi:protein TonB